MTHDDSRRVSVLLGLLFGLAGMGSSSAAIALPLMAQDLGVGVGVAAWTISLYALMLAVTTAVYGRVSDLVGVRMPLLVGIGLMTAGALVAALAPTFGVLLGARLFQGAGAAAVPTLGVAVLSGRYDGAVRGLALGRLAGIAAAVSCLGPLVGGLVEHAFGWRAVMALPILGRAGLPVPLARADRRGHRREPRHPRRRAGRRHRRRAGAARAVAVDRPAWSRSSGSGCWCSARPRSRCGCAAARTASCRSR